MHTTTSLDPALLLPIVVISLILFIVALVDLLRRDQVRGGNKWVWLAVIVIGGSIGQIVYLLAGRGES